MSKSIVTTWEYKGATLEIAWVVMEPSVMGHIISMFDDDFDEGDGTGHFCGYVTLPKPLILKGEARRDIDVHGDITHEEDDRTYGFDCGHAGDSSPTSPTKNIEWVKAETERLADQLIALQSDKPTTPPDRTGSP